MLEGLSKDENELLSLCLFFKRELNRVKKINPLDAGELAMEKTIDTYIRDLQALPAKLKIKAEDRKKRHYHESINPKCPQCGNTEKLKPLQPAKDKFGYTCNRFFCNECNTAFIDETPNNIKDIYLWNKNFLEQVEIAGEDGLTYKEKFNITKTMIEQMKSYNQSTEKIIEEVEKIDKQEDEVAQDFKKMVIQVRDHLLALKKDLIAKGTVKPDN